MGGPRTIFKNGCKTFTVSTMCLQKIIKRQKKSFDNLIWKYGYRRSMGTDREVWVQQYWRKVERQKVKSENWNNKSKNNVIKFPPAN